MKKQDDSLSVLDNTIDYIQLIFKEIENCINGNGGKIPFKFLPDGDHVYCTIVTDDVDMVITLNLYNELDAYSISERLYKDNNRMSFGTARNYRFIINANHIILDKKKFELNFTQSSTRSDLEQVVFEICLLNSYGYNEDLIAQVVVQYLYFTKYSHLYKIHFIIFHDWGKDKWYKRD